MQYQCKWTPHEDAVCQIHLAKAQERGLNIWQTRSHAICTRFSANRLHRKVVSQGGDKTFVSKTLHASARSENNSQRRFEIKAAGPQQDSTRSTGKPVADEETPFEVDLRIQGMPQDAVIEDQERMSNKFKNWLARCELDT